MPFPVSCPAKSGASSTHRSIDEEKLCPTRSRGATGSPAFAGDDTTESQAFGTEGTEREHAMSYLFRRPLRVRGIACAVLALLTLSGSIGTAQTLAAIKQRGVIAC